MKSIGRFAIKIVGASVIIFGLCGYSCTSRVSSESAPASPPLPVVIPVATPARGNFASDNTPQCRTNEFGIKEKVIITRRGVSCTQEPGGVDNGFKLDYYHSYFVFDVKEVNGINYYQVGITPRVVNVKGWVAANNAQSWDTAIGVRYARYEKDEPEYQVASIPPPLYVYATKEEAIKPIKGESAEPLAQTNYDYQYKAQMAWPIIKQEAFSYQGKTYELFQIAFLSEYQSGGNVNAPPPPTPAPETKQVKQQRTRTVRSGAQSIDMIFVIDSTLSTTPYIEAVKETIRTIMNNLNAASAKAADAFKPSIAFGLVEYRDFINALYFTDNNQKKVYRTFQLTKDIPAFLERINVVKAADIDSAGWQEAVLDGLQAALTEINWSNEYSEKALVLIGDNSGHSADSPENPTGSKSPNNLYVRDITDLANKKQATVYSLMVRNQGNPEEVARHRQQFMTFAEQTGGKCFPLEAANEVVRLVLERIVTPKTDFARGKYDVVQSNVMGMSQSAIREKVGEKQYAEVMKWLDKHHIAIRDLRPDDIFFSTGWVVSEAGGVKVLLREAYMARSELNVLLTNLQELKDFLIDPSAYKTIIASAFAPRVMEHMPIFLKEEISLPMNIWLQIQGVPLSEYSMLKLNKSDLEQLSEETRRNIRHRIERQCLKALGNDYTNNIRFPSQDDMNSFGWVRERYLP